MILQVLGSSSSGNGYILTSRSGESLILECGIKFSEVVKVLNYEINLVIGALVSHNHKDHSGYITEYQNRGVDVYSCKDVAEKHSDVIVLDVMQKYQIGEFIVMPIKAFHSVECYAYLIEHPEMGRLLFATDTYEFNYKFKDLNHILIEANHSEEVIIENAIEDKWSSSFSKNHLSIEEAIEFVKLNYSSELQNVVLLHLSRDNADSKAFQKRFYDELGIGAIVAKKELCIKLMDSEF